MSDKIGQKHCINCSAELTSSSTENKSAFYVLNCSSRVRSPAPLSPASVEFIPVHQALATIFNFETLEKVSKVSVVDHVDTDNGLENKNPFKKFQFSASAVPICYVCYLVLSDLYRNYTEFSQLRKTDSFLGSKLKELENQLIGHRPKQSQQSSFTSGSIPNEVPDSNQDCNLNRTNLIGDLEVMETTTTTNTRASLISESTAPDHDNDFDSNINLLPKPRKLKIPGTISGSRHVHLQKMDKLGLDLDDGISASSSDQMQANPQKDRKLSIQRCIESLVHACQCKGIEGNCRLPSCRKMKRVVAHAKVCKRKTKGGCPICKQLIALCCYHAKHCQEAKCPVPFCANTKQKIRQQQARRFRQSQGSSKSDICDDISVITID